ncbi:MAG: HDIG domain-containing protein [Halanaerobiales bacterium]|nr:HDIG domain-containing protein [Halanaerobiales bacterium]
MIIHRIKQFFSAITARVEEEEKEFISKYLNEDEKKLFYQMSIVDQRHALDVCCLVAESLKFKEKDNKADNQFLIRAALLHDVGKLAGDLTLFDRIIIVLIDSFIPGRIEIWGEEGRGNFLKNRLHAFYIACNHGLIGAKLLEKISCDLDLITIIRDHHLPETSDWRMTILQEADKKR